MVLGWRCWYDDGSVYSSKESEWADLPDDGLLIRMIYYEGGGKQIQSGSDYFYEAPHFSGEPILGEGKNLNNIETRYPGAIIKKGRWAPDGYFRNLVDESMKRTWDDD